MTECVLKSYFRAFIRLKWCQKVLEVEPGLQFASHQTEITEAMLCLDLIQRFKLIVFRLEIGINVGLLVVEEKSTVYARLQVFSMNYK